MPSERTFPMYTVTLETILKITTLPSHEELLDAGLLCDFHEQMGRAVFVSHQWVSYHHPDPHSQQFKILQMMLQRLLSGACRVVPPVPNEIYWGRMKVPTVASFRSQPLYIWYDYMSVPQGRDSESVAKRHDAIRSIHTYVAGSFFFFILCPPVPHAEEDILLTSQTWSHRGWCRSLVLVLVTVYRFLVQLLLEADTNPAGLEWGLSVAKIQSDNILQKNFICKTSPECRGV